MVLFAKICLQPLTIATRLAGGTVQHKITAFAWPAAMGKQGKDPIGLSEGRTLEGPSPAVQVDCDWQLLQVCAAITGELSRCPSSASLAFFGASKAADAPTEKF